MNTISDTKNFQMSLAQWAVDTFKPTMDGKPLTADDILKDLDGLSITDYLFDVYDTEFHDKLTSNQTVAFLVSFPVRGEYVTEWIVSNGYYFSVVSADNVLEAMTFA